MIATTLRSGAPKRHWDALKEIDTIAITMTRTSYRRSARPRLVPVCRPATRLTSGDLSGRGRDDIPLVTGSAIRQLRSQRPAHAALPTVRKILGLQGPVGRQNKEIVAVSNRVVRLDLHQGASTSTGSTSARSA